MKVSDLIHSRTDIFSVQEDVTIQEAVCYLREKQVRAAGVRNREGKLVGVLSQSDVSDKVAAENKCPAWVRASEVMSADLITVSPELSLDDCLRLMEKHGIYHLLVVDEKGDYRGMISVQDLLKVIASDQKERARQPTGWKNICSPNISLRSLAGQASGQGWTAPAPASWPVFRFVFASLVVRF